MKTTNPGNRMVIYVKDIQRMQGCSYNTAKDMMDTFLKDLNIEGKNLSVGNFSDQSGLPSDEISENIRDSDATDRKEKEEKKRKNKA